MQSGIGPGNGDLPGTPRGERPRRGGGAILHFPRRRLNTLPGFRRNPNLRVIVEDTRHQAGRKSQSRRHIT